MENEEIISELVNLAREASKNAYAPYSSFHVGVALKTTNGNIFTGCNVEFSDYLALHAEVNAIGSAVTEGDTDIEAIVVYSYSSPPALPCGSCRQKIYEFSRLNEREIKVLAINDKNERIEKKISELLPGGEIFLDKKE